MKKVLLLCGGNSPEHNVSLISAQSILKNIDKNGKKYSYSSGKRKKIDMGLQWWQNPGIYPSIPVRISDEGRGKMSLALKFLIWGIWLLLIVGGTVCHIIAIEMESAERAERWRQQRQQHNMEIKRIEQETEYYQRQIDKMIQDDLRRTRY